MKKKLKWKNNINYFSKIKYLKIVLKKIKKNQRIEKNNQLDYIQKNNMYLKEFKKLEIFIKLLHLIN